MEPKVLALNLVQRRFIWCVPYLERVQGALDGVRRGPVGPPGPLELAALYRDVAEGVAVLRVAGLGDAPAGLAQGGDPRRAHEVGDDQPAVLVVVRQPLGRRPRAAERKSYMVGPNCGQTLGL